MLADAQGTEAALTDDQALELARIALVLAVPDLKDPRISSGVSMLLGSPILQSRPLKQMAAPRSPGPGAGSQNYPVLFQGGELASSGVAAGPVHVVANNLDLLQFPAGAVLVTAFPHLAGLPP